MRAAKEEQSLKAEEETSAGVCVGCFFASVAAHRFEEACACRNPLPRFAELIMNPSTDADIEPYLDRSASRTCCIILYTL